MIYLPLMGNIQHVLSICLSTNLNHIKFIKLLHSSYFWINYLDQKYPVRSLWNLQLNPIRLHAALWSYIKQRTNWSVEDDALSVRNKLCTINSILFIINLQNECNVPPDYVSEKCMVTCSHWKDSCRPHLAVQRKQFANYDYSPSGVLWMDSTELTKDKVCFFVESHIWNVEQKRKDTENLLTMQSTIIWWWCVVIQ